MHRTLKLRLVAALSLASAWHSAAQSTPDPSGHWEGAIMLPGRQLRFEIDLLRTGQGLLGLATMPDENLKGIPLNLTIGGNSIRFHARKDQPFDGVFSADLKSVDGEYTIEGNVLPFHMTRTGDAADTRPAPGPPVSARLEGEWSGTLAVNGANLKLLLTMENRGAGSGAALVDVDQGGLQLPAVIRQSEPVLVVEIAGGATWSGSFNTDRNELTGSYQERGRSVPLSFRRVASQQ